MTRSTSKQWHTVSLSGAVTMPRFVRLGGYADEQRNPGNG
jgi:hypothetical protein